MAEDLHGTSLWIAYKHEALEMWKNLERDPDPERKSNWVVSDPIKSPLLRLIEVAVLEQIKIIGGKFLNEDPPPNWDFLVYLDMMARPSEDEKDYKSDDHRWSFVQLGFFYNFKRWTVADREQGIAKAIKRLGFGKIGLKV